MRRMRPAKPSAIASPSQLPGELRRASALMARRQWEEALTLLQSTLKRFPHSREALMMLLEVARETDDVDLLEETAETLAQRLPNDPMVQLMWAQILVVGGYQALGRKQFRAFLGRWPHHSEGDKVRKLLQDLEADLTGMLDAAGLTGESRFELAALNDEMRYRIEHEQFAQAEALGRQILAEDPHYTPALNNLSLCRFIQGDIAGATAMVRRILEFAPDNVHALAGLAHYLLLEGEETEARECAQRMRASAAFAANRYIKEAETYSFLGDDAAMIDVYHRALEAQHADAEDPDLLNMAAAAFARSGQETEAQRLWKEVLKEDPENNQAKQNLEDLHLPVGKRYGAWALYLNQWIPHRLILEFANVLEVAEKDEAAAEQKVREFVEKYPMLVHILPYLLERGEPYAQEFALMLAQGLRSPEALEALHTFAFGQNGPDALRMRAASIVTRAGLQEPGPVSFWIEGAWQQTMMMGFEITGEPTSYNHSPRVQRLLERWQETLQTQEYTKAEALLKEALQSEPDAPDIRNNLAAVYSMQGRSEEFKEIILDLYDDYPDYFFARINMAHLWLHDQNPEMAAEVIKPLLSRTRLHFSEFRGLATTQLRIATQRENIEEAEHWMRLWEQIEEHPMQETWREIIAQMRQPIPAPRGRRKRK